MPPPEIIVAAAAAVSVFASMRKGRRRVFLTIAVFVAATTAAVEWGWVPAALTYAMLFVAVTIRGLIKYPYKPCKGCGGNGKFLSSYTTAMALCPTCGGNGRRVRYWRQVLTDWAGLPEV